MLRPHLPSVSHRTRQTETPIQHLDRRAALARLGGGSLAAVLASRELGSALAQHATPAPGSTEANKANVLPVFEDAINTHNPALVYELYAPEFVDRNASPGHLPGPAGIEQALIYFNTILPDVEVTVDAITAEDDLVATQETWRGTDPTTGREVQVWSHWRNSSRRTTFTVIWSEAGHAVVADHHCRQSLDRDASGLILDRQAKTPDLHGKGEGRSSLAQGGPCLGQS